MKTIARLGIATATIAATAAFVGFGAGAADAAPARHPAPVGTVFVQNDATTGNQVVGYDRFADGTLRQSGVFATGGKGVALGGSVVDHLASESSLARAGRNVFAVNAGSDTITSFAVRGDRLESRQVVGSGGDAPVSIAAHGDLVYVLNARGGGSIQGYLDLGGRLVAVPGWHRDLGFNPNATPEFTSTPAQIAFTPDGSKVVVSTKGDSSSFDVFPLGVRGPAATPVVSTFAGDVPFGFQFDATGQLIASEAGPNAVASFTVHQNGAVTKDAEQATGQQATCWIVVDGTRVYASNAGSGTLSGYTAGRTGALTPIGTTATDAGTTDAAVSADGRYLYVQTGAAGIVDEYQVAATGALHEIGSVTVPNGVGGEGIVAN
ncbi:lactonase family protein [Gryllotalpicola reticulitermitis]|uniref:Lactonase family protein n=1 Tax=Gryllotalpicola reticulitermitis TaxID=1184153 RepID=A0ABV8Q2R5_9MICO